MLLTLRIRNLAIVEDLSVEFGPGLNVLTGETGAGKSILVGALDLVTGARADRSAVRSGVRRATVEALFEPSPKAGIPEWLSAHGFHGDGEVEQVLIHREIAAGGSGRILVNGSPCTLGLLRELGRRLLELHGQHEHQGLLAPERHLALLDGFSGSADELDRVQRASAAVLAAGERRESLRGEMATRTARRNDLERLVAEIEALRPRPDELAALDRERTILRSAGRVAELLDAVVALGYDGEQSASSLAAAAAKRAEALAELDPSLGDPARRMREAAIELQDAGAQFRDYRDRAEFDPARLDEIEQRRAAIERLCLHHGRDEAELGELRDEGLRELEELLSLDEAVDRGEAELRRLEGEYTGAAEALSRRRSEGAGPLASAVERQLRSLAFERAKFEVSLLAGGGDASAWSPRGAERAEFLLAANPGEPFRALHQVASGGELSRVMLALHVAGGRGPRGRVLVFDEVDAGVGGAVADAIGARLAGLARSHQVLCVTHLPQLAAHADSHYHVKKSVVRGRTSARAAGLDAGGRVAELARMLAGRSATDASRRHAAELLDAAGSGRSKRTRRRA